MRRRFLSVPIVGSLLLSSLACSDGSPTAPVPTSAQGTVGLESVTSSRPARRAGIRVAGPRVVPPRVSAAPQLQGLWGGDHVGLTIQEGGAAVEFDCAEGSIDESFITDSSGRFSLLGSWWFTPPVVVEGWQPEKRPARYSGVVKAGTMTLTVIRLDDNQLLGSFTLAFNQIPRTLHCL